MWRVSKLTALLKKRETFSTSLSLKGATPRGAAATAATRAVAYTYKTRVLSNLRSRFERVGAIVWGSLPFDQNRCTTRSNARRAVVREPSGGTPVCFFLSDFFFNSRLKSIFEKRSQSREVCRFYEVLKTKVSRWRVGHVLKSDSRIEEVVSNKRVEGRWRVTLVLKRSFQ